jgi:hypothetical protein
MFQGIPAMMVSGGVPGAAPPASGWTKKRTVTVDNLYVPSTQTDFAVLLSYTDNGFKTTGNGGSVTSSSGFDIRPFSDSGLTTALTFELESYNGLTGAIAMWVKISSLSSASDTIFYIAYGNALITTDGSSNATWDSSYIGVWHLGNGTTLSLADSTSNGYTLTNNGTVGATTGQIDGAAGSFNGTNQSLNTGTLTSGVNKMTISAWINITSFSNSDDLMFEYSTNFNSVRAWIVDPNDGSGVWGVSCHADPLGYNGGSFTRPATGVHHCVFTFDTTTGTALSTAAYIDGVSQTMTQGTFADLTGVNFSDFPLHIMSRGGVDLFMPATYLDEVRLSNIIRSADWVTTLYNNQSNPGVFAALGTEGPG